MSNINENTAKNNLVSNLDQNLGKSIPPSSTVNPEQKDILTLRKHSMDYFTKDGVILRTGYDNRVYWYLLCLKELWDNAADFLTKYYKGADDTKIITRINKDDKLFRISVRNSNYRNIEVFSDKDTIFNFEGRAGTKQGVHVISRGLLGDAMKQLLSLGYVMSNLNEDATELGSNQWEEPLIIRHNGEEWKIWLYVDKVMQNGFPKIECTNQKVDYTDTEIELALPIVNAAKNLSRARIEIFCKEYATLTTDITLKFRILDNSTPLAVAKEEIAAKEQNDVIVTTSDNDGVEEETELTDEEIEKSITANIISALTISADKAIVNLEFPGLHPISLESLNNANSAHTCTLSEFADRIINAQGKDKITIHEFLQTYREGTQLPKTVDNQKTLEDLVSEANRDDGISKYYRQLRAALPAAKEITLPYKRDVRKDALIKRISKLYDIDKNQKPVYKLIHGFYDDTKVRKIYIDKNTSRFEEGKGLIKFPYVFEIIAIPRNKPLEGEFKLKPKQTIFIVNYSTSPKANIFEGEYGYLANNSRNIIEVLQACHFHTYHGPSSKLPCIIIGNLITLRREPHGYDKSRIDIQPFSDTIIKACIKVAGGVKTYRGDGYHFTTSTKYSTAKQHKASGREELDRILTNFLRQERGLP